MIRILSALISGIVFGLGIAISGMGNPAKVMNFFDPLGTWDPSLAFVMGGALVVTGIGYRLIPGLAEGLLPKLHFWLHQVGALLLLAGLFLMMTGRVAEATIGPVFPVLEGAVLLGAALWLVGVIRHA